MRETIATLPMVNFRPLGPNNVRFITELKYDSRSRKWLHCFGNVSGGKLSIRKLNLFMHIFPGFLGRTAYFPYYFYQRFSWPIGQLNASKKYGPSKLDAVVRRLHRNVYYLQYRQYMFCQFQFKGILWQFFVFVNENYNFYTLLV